MTEYILETTGDLFINGVKIPAPEIAEPPTPEPEPPTIEPEPKPPQPEPTEFLFPSDWEETPKQSTLL